MWRRGWARSEQDEFEVKTFKGEKKKKKNSGEERVGRGKCQMREKGTGSPSDVIAQLRLGVFYMVLEIFNFLLENDAFLLEIKY